MALRILGRTLQDPTLVEIEIEGKKIQSISGPKDTDRTLGGLNSWVTPGFFDIQVNGFAGIDFNTLGLSTDDLYQVVEKLREKGVLFFCPTIITNSFEHQCACLKALHRASRDSTSIPCLHLEGPYLSPEDGPRGAHPLAYIRQASWEEFQRFQDCAGGMIGMVTLAPEVAGAIQLTEKLVSSGEVVAIGHTAASPTLIRAAVQAGARTSTHLGNGSHLSLPRHQNYIWEQLASDAMSASFIVDGHHLPPAVAKAMIRAKGWQRSILTSDAISAAGMPPGSYRLGEVEIVVSRDYRVELADRLKSGILAGSALDLLRGVENAVRFADVSLESAILMASKNPAELMGMGNRLGRIAPNSEANLIVFRNQEGDILLDYAIQEGQVVWARHDS